MAEWKTQSHQTPPQKPAEPRHCSGVPPGLPNGRSAHEECAHFPNDFILSVDEAVMVRMGERNDSSARKLIAKTLVLFHHGSSEVTQKLVHHSSENSMS